jgi:hypothetical protein
MAHDFQPDQRLDIEKSWSTMLYDDNMSQKQH